ncbi:MAG: DUF4381 domain-containing protein [Pseudomonadota bacterium]
MNSDSGSLERLHDILPAAPPPWWPPAAGWYLLCALLMLLALWTGHRAWRRYRCNRYRRAALAELAAITSASADAELAHLPELLKRTALHAYPRAQVAALSGAQWIAFLDAHCEGTLFAGEAGELLESLAYRPALAEGMNPQVLIDSIRRWIGQHRAEPC